MWCHTGIKFPLFLYEMGCSGPEIVRLLGVKETSVYPTLSRARRGKKD
jgi:hypothetical protein